MKEFCRYAVWDDKTGVLLVCGEKYKVKQGLEYIGSFRSLQSRLRKVKAYARQRVVKGRKVNIVFWFNTPKRKPICVVTEAGAVLGLR